MEHTLVAVARGTGLTGIDTGNDEDLILNLFLNLSESGNVVKNAVFVVRGAGTDDESELVGFACKDFFDFNVSCFLDRGQFVRDRVHCFDLLRNREFTDEFHIHNDLPSFCNILKI